MTSKARSPIAAHGGKDGRHIGIPKRRDVVASLVAQGDAARRESGRATQRRAQKPAPITMARSFSIGWPPGYQTHLTEAEIKQGERSARASASSTKGAEAGKGHAGTDMGLPGSRRDAKPGRMGY